MRGRILVVDDDRLVRSAIARVLADEGYTVDMASDGVDALRLIGASRPDVILLDFLMPRMNGKQVLEVLRTDEETSEIPVLVMTTVTGIAPDPSADATNFVQKPFEVEALLDKVALAIYRTRSNEVRDKAGMVIIVHPDLAEAARFDQSLSAVGFTTVTLTEIAEELPRLARVLEPRAIVVALPPKNDEELEILRLLRDEQEPAGTPIMVVSDSAELTDADWATSTVPTASAEHMAAFIAAKTQ